MSPPMESDSVPSDDPLIRGVLEVHAPSDRMIQGIEIKLKALQSVALIDSGMHTGTEDSIVFEKVINLGLEAPEAFGSHSNQTRSPSPINRTSSPPNGAVTPQLDRRTSSEGREVSPQHSRPGSLRRKSTADSEGSSSGIFLTRGIHGFEFSILLPSSSPPYERSTFGRVLWMLSATAFGAGRAKGNISTERPIYPVVNPNPDGGPVILSTGFHDLSTVGLLAADFTSDNLCVGGALRIDIRGPEPKEGLKLHLVKVSIESNITLETKKQGILQLPKRQNVLFIKGYVPPQMARDAGQGNKNDGIIYDGSIEDSDANKEWSVEGVVRLPDDNTIRPTTLDGSAAAIRWSHNLLMQLVYSFPNAPEAERGLKVFSVRNKITVPSCCASHDAVRLPQYQACAKAPPIPSNSLDATSQPPLLPDSPWSMGSTVLWGPRHFNCVCGQSLADLERSIIPKRSNSHALVDSMTQRKIDDCSCPDSPNYTPSNPNGFPYPSPPDSASSLSSHNARRSSSTGFTGSSSPSRIMSVDDSLGIPSLDLENSTSTLLAHRSRSLGYNQRQRSVELDGDPPTYACAMEDVEERGRER